MLKQVCLSLLVFGFGIANAPQNHTILVGFPSLLEEIDTRFDLLGGSTQLAWIPDKNTAPATNTRYNLWNLKGKLSTIGSGSARAAQPTPCQRRYSVNVQPALHREGWLVASSAPWNLRPRSVTAIPPNNPTYLEAIRKHLENAGRPGPTSMATSWTKSFWLPPTASATATCSPYPTATKAPTG
jgi:hypothetical protein